MRLEDVNKLTVKDLKNVMRPLKRGKVLKHCVDIGFDTEFTSEDNSAHAELLSLQFSLSRGKSAIYYINSVAGITSHQLLAYVLQFLESQGIFAEKDIYLITYYGIAELSKISDFYEPYFDAFRKIMIRPRLNQFNGAISWSKKFDSHNLHIIDLFGHMQGGLEKVGQSLGFEKLKLSADGKDHEYWITHMKELQTAHADIFETYAIRDAEVTIEAWRNLKEKYVASNLDPHVYPTFGSITIGAFRRLMTKYPCAVTEEPRLSSQRKPNSLEYREHLMKDIVYAGSLDVRVAAALSYWGGNNQAFARGYFKNIDATYYDFKSLYIIAGILQPLSNEDTLYKSITLQDVREGAEGFCVVDFEFPSATMYPTLPVQENYYRKLMFPLQGISYCTASEVRFALTLGVRVDSFRGFGFYPTANEVNSDLRAFFEKMLKRKTELDNANKRDSIEREMLKGDMVATVGRFAYQKPSHTAEDITRLLHVSGLQNEEFRNYGRKRAVRSMYERSEVGSSWAIEWASLILGKARSLAAWAVNRGERCFLISTDGGVWLGDPKFNESEIGRELEAHYSGVRLESKVDELLIIRNRVYAFWLDGKLIHLARMGIAIADGRRCEKDAKFESILRESLQAGSEIYKECTPMRLSKVQDFMLDGVPLNSRIRRDKPTRINWRFDGKRLLDHEINVFSGDHTFTHAHVSVESAYFSENPKGKAGRLKVELTQSQIDLIKNNPTLTHSALAKLLGKSETTTRIYRKKVAEVN